MKKIKKLFKKLNNQGSSIVMVIVALAFIGIIVGALLTAVGYSYRLKLQDLNARDNFYYVEQAMNEIYAGVGSNVVDDMRDAYTYTIENMVRYDLATKSYITLSDDEVQAMFAERFMLEVQNNALFSNASGVAIGAELEKYITNETVVLDDSKLRLDYGKDENGKIVKVIIKNVTLTRTINYDKSVANGAYTQTITTDIEIGEPDFKVIFNADAANTPNIFGFAMVADMGVEINQPSTPLTITGNIYAAADYYNKTYNESTYDSNGDDEKIFKKEAYTFKYQGLKYDEETGEYVVADDLVINDLYTHRSVTSKEYTNSDETNGYQNKVYAELMSDDGDYSFNGVNERSMYSGFFVEDGDVSILADTVIVPGTVAVMDEATVSIYGKQGNETAYAELWADNIVLGGSYSKDIDDVDADEIKYTGSTLLLKVNAYIKDDTELNAYGSNLKLNGGYYGYGDSTEKDTRVFVPSAYSAGDTDYASNFQIVVPVLDSYGNPTYDTEGKPITAIENRDHYNSSAIIVNGQQSTLDLALAESIYLAGRSYIELSKEVTVTEEKNETTGTGSATGSNTSNTDIPEYTVTETYAFVSKGDDLTSDKEEDKVFLRDYKTGESISLKTNQVAYIPVSANGIPTPKYDSTNNFLGYWEAELPPALAMSTLFETFFPSDIYGKDTDDDGKIDKSYVPCIMQEVSGKKYYYYDFETAHRHVKAYMLSKGTEVYNAFNEAYPSAQYYASAFIEAYVAELNDEDSVISAYLKDISDFEDMEFDAGNIILPAKYDKPDSKVYSSGAITSKTDTEFKIVQSSVWDDGVIAKLLLDSEYPGNQITYTEDGKSVTYNGLDDIAYKYSNGFEEEYNYVKWNLGHYTSADTYTNNKNTAEKAYIDALVDDAEFGEALITPINKYLNMDIIVDAMDISPAKLELKSGNKVWISDKTVIIDAKDKDGNVASDGTVRGIVITKQDVVFDETVRHFEGLIVSGGKIYVTSYSDDNKTITPNLQSVTASAGVCESVIKECMTSSDVDAKAVLKIFKDYESLANQESDDDDDEDDDSDKAKTIDNIDYSDVCRFNNWMKNVE